MAHGIVSPSPRVQTSMLSPSATLRTDSVDSVFSESGELFSRLDEMSDNIDQSFQSPVGQVPIASTVTTAAGYLLYDIRKVSVLSALFSAVPHWQQFDPLDVLDSLSKGDAAASGHDAETLLEPVDESSSH